MHSSKNGRDRTQTTLSFIVSVPEHLVLRHCLREFVLEHTIEIIRRLFGLDGTRGRYTTRAILCHVRPLSSIQLEGIPSRRK